MTLISDDEIVKQVAQKDEEAFLVLYDRYSKRVYALALRMVGDGQTAEEITQDVFLKLWSRAKSFLATQGRFATWLLTITRNTTFDRLRMENRRPQVSNENDPEEIWEFLTDEQTTSEEARWRSLYFATQTLPKEQRLAIDLAYYQGLSHSEIAEQLGWPVGTVKTRIRMGMDQLRQLWLENGPQDQKSKSSSDDVLKE